MNTHTHVFGHVCVCVCVCVFVYDFSSLFLKFIFNGSIVALKSSVVFCCTTT